MYEGLLKYRNYLFVTGAALIYIIAQSQYIHDDFQVFLAAGEHLFHHENPYKIWLTRHDEIAGKFIYGPAFAILMIPFSCLPDKIAFVIFFLFQTLLLMRSFNLISRMLLIDQWEKTGQGWWWVLSILISLRFIMHNVESGQVTILLFYLSIEAMYQFSSGNKLLGAGMLGLAIHIKLLPLIFIPYLLLLREFRLVVYAMGFSMLLFSLPLLFNDFSFTRQLVYDWAYCINPLGTRYTEEQDQLSFQMQGLQAIFATYLLKPPFRHSGIHPDWIKLSTLQFQVIINMARLLLLLFSIYFIRAIRLNGFDKSPRSFWSLSYFYLMVPLIFPVQQKYSFLFMTPFFCYMVWYILYERRPSHIPDKKWKAIAAGFAGIILLTTFTSDLFVGMELNLLFQNLKVLTFAGLLAIPLLAISKPSPSPAGV